MTATIATIVTILLIPIRGDVVILRSARWWSSPSPSDSRRPVWPLHNAGPGWEIPEVNGVFSWKHHLANDGTWMMEWWNDRGYDHRMIFMFFVNDGMFAGFSSQVWFPVRSTRDYGLPIREHLPKVAGVVFAGRGEGYDVDYLFGQVEIKDPWWVRCQIIALGQPQRSSLKTPQMIFSMVFLLL